jgi:hypothetical protein
LGWRVELGLRCAPRASGAMTPARAGTERASRGGVSLAPSHANAEGPRRGSRSPVAGGGVCRRRARRRPSLQLDTAVAVPAKKEASRSEAERGRRSRPAGHGRKPHAVRSGSGDSGRSPGGARTLRASRCAEAEPRRRGTPAGPRGPRVREEGGSVRSPREAGTPTGDRARLPEPRCR